MESKKVSLFTPEGIFFEDRTINDENFYEMVAYMGLRLCEGYMAQMEGIKYPPIKLPDFLADVNNLKNIDNLFDFFFPILTYIRQIQFEDLTDFYDSNPEI